MLMFIWMDRGENAPAVLWRSPATLTQPTPHCRRACECRPTTRLHTVRRRNGPNITLYWTALEGAEL